MFVDVDEDEDDDVSSSLFFIFFSFFSWLSFPISWRHVLCGCCKTRKRRRRRRRRKVSLRINRNIQHLRLLSDERNSIKASFLVRVFFFFFFFVASVGNVHTLNSIANGSFQFNYSCNIHSLVHYHHHFSDAREYQKHSRTIFHPSSSSSNHLPTDQEKENKERERKRQSLSHLSLLVYSF